MVLVNSTWPCYRVKSLPKYSLSTISLLVAWSTGFTDLFFENSSISNVSDTLWLFKCANKLRVMTRKKIPVKITEHQNLRLKDGVAGTASDRYCKSLILKIEEPRKYANEKTDTCISAQSTIYRHCHVTLIFLKFFSNWKAMVWQVSNCFDVHFSGLRIQPREKRNTNCLTAVVTLRHSEPRIWN